jgi:hypothetical protein
MTDDQSRFTLRRIIWPHGKPSLDPEDYSVVVDGKDIGRIYRTLAPGGQQRWRWSLYSRNAGGLVDSIEDANEAFRKAWEAK